MKAFREAMSWIIPILIGLIIALVIKQFSSKLFVLMDHPCNLIYKTMNGYSA